MHRQALICCFSIIKAFFPIWEDVFEIASEMSNKARLLHLSVLAANIP